MVVNYLKIRVEKVKLLIDEIYEEIINEFGEMEGSDVKVMDEYIGYIDEIILKLYNIIILFES